MNKLARLAYLLAQHPFRLHRKLVQRGLATGWIREFSKFWDTVRPPGLPITDYASYTWLEYYFASRFRERYPEGDHFEDRDAQYARLLSYVKRRELHPLRMLKVAWALRGCNEVLEFGAGSAPYAHFVETVWLTSQQVFPVDLPGLMKKYQDYQFEVRVPRSWYVDGIVCTETFEHLSNPYSTAEMFLARAPRVICFDYIDNNDPERERVINLFRTTGDLTGPDARGLYIWRHITWSSISSGAYDLHGFHPSGTSYALVGMTSSTTGTPEAPPPTTSGKGTRKRAGARTKKR